MVGAARRVVVWVCAAVAAGLVSTQAHSAETFAVVSACRGGLPNGAYELHDQDGHLRAVGAFASGRKTGTFVFWTAGGARSAVIPYDKDARAGTVALWYTGGRRELARKLEAPYSDNVLHGVVRSYYPSGAPRTECRYDHGRLASAQAWDAHGTQLPAEQARKRAANDIEVNSRLLAQFDAMVGANLPRCE